MTSLFATTPLRSYNSFDEQEPHEEEIMNGTSSQQLTFEDMSPITMQRQSQSKMIISIDEAVDRIGNGRFQNQILFAAGTSFMADSMEIMLLTFLTSVLQVEWNWQGDHPIEVPIITSSMFLGALIGTLILGPLGDRIGRYPVLLGAAVIISFFGLITALSHNFATLVFIRFMVGFGIGGLTVPFDILAEFLPTENRGRYLLLIEYFWTLGSILVPIMAYVSLELFYSWKLLVTLCAIPCILSLYASIKYVPESPRWLVQVGRNEEAVAILRKAAAVNGIDPDIVFPQGCIIRCDEVENCNFSELLKPKWRKLTLKIWMVWIGFAFSYYGVIMTVTRIFGKENGLDGNEKVTFDYGAIFVSSTAELVGTAIVVFLVDRIGRIPIQVFSYATGGIGLFLLCLFSYHNASNLVLIPLSFAVRICEMTGTCVTWISTAEILSTEIRSTGHSAANAVARIGGFCAPFLVAGDVSIISIGVVMLVVHSVTSAFASMLPETKGVELGKAAREWTQTEEQEHITSNMTELT